MYINTKAIFEWDDNLKQYIEIHNEGYEYEGELELAQYYDEDTMSPAGTYGYEPPAYEYSPDMGQFSNVFGESGLEDTLRSLYNIDPSELSPEERKMLTIYDPKTEQGYRQGAISNIGSIYGSAGKELFKARQAPTTFAGGGNLSDMMAEDMYETAGAKVDTTLLDYTQKKYSAREDWAEGISPILEYIETQRGTPITRMSVGEEEGTEEGRANCRMYAQRFPADEQRSMYDHCMSTM